MKRYFDWLCNEFIKKHPHYPVYRIEPAPPPLGSDTLALLIFTTNKPHTFLAIWDERYEDFFIIEGLLDEKTRE